VHNQLKVLLAMTVVSIFAAANQASACYDGAGVPICKGDTVLLNDSSGYERVGEVLQVFTNGKTEVRYFRAGDKYQVWRNANQVYPEIHEYHLGAGNPIVKNNSVLLRNKNGEGRQGQVAAMFQNGRAFVKYKHEGYDNEIWTDVKDLSPAVSSYRDIEINDCVVFSLDGTRSGKVTSIFENGYLCVRAPNGKDYFPQVGADDVAKSTDCVVR
jgi:hypothetical protein